MGSKREKSNIAIAILKVLVEHPKLIHIFGGTNNIFININNLFSFRREKCNKCRQSKYRSKF